MNDMELHDVRAPIYIGTGDKITFCINRKSFSSEPSKRCGTLDTCKTMMLAELYKQDGFSLVFGED